MKKSTTGRRDSKRSRSGLAYYFSCRPVREPFKYDSTSSEEDDIEIERKLASERGIKNPNCELRPTEYVPVNIKTSTTSTITTTKCMVTALTLCSIGKEGQITTFYTNNISSNGQRSSESPHSKLQGIRRVKVLKF